MFYSPQVQLGTSLPIVDYPLGYSGRSAHMLYGQLGGPSHGELHDKASFYLLPGMDCL